MVAETDRVIETLMSEMSRVALLRAPAQTLALRSAIDDHVRSMRAALQQERDASAAKFQDIQKEKDRLQNIMVGLQDSAEKKDSLDSLTFIFGGLDNPSTKRITRSRSLVSQWSSVFEALTRHGNGMENSFPKEIHLKDVDPQVFKVASEFMLSGILETEHVCLVDQPSHPLLEFGDMYGLSCLVEEYFTVMIKREELTLNNAPKVLELSLRYNATSSRDKAAEALAQSPETFFAYDPGDVEADEWDLFGYDERPLPPPGRVCGSFFKLSPEAARTVLLHDDLRIQLKFDPKIRGEKLVLLIIELWTQQNPNQAHRASSLLDAVRFELLSIEHLTDVYEKLKSSTSLGEALWTQISRTLSETLKKKLAVDGDGVGEQGRAKPIRKRKWGCHGALCELAESAEGAAETPEQKHCKMLRTALELCSKV